MVDRDESGLQLEYRGISDGQRKVEDPTTSYMMGGNTTSSSDMYSTSSAPGLSMFNNASANGFSSTDPARTAAALKNPVMRDSSSNMAQLTHAMLFRHAFATVDLAAVESSRPKRRNVRISKDPQSVAARHRRERISDRIRVLQRLVPGGTKMDTASMLDEAINYVKFLQAQVQTLETVSGASGGFDPRLGFGPNPLYRTSPLSYSSVSMDCVTDSSSQGLSAVPSDHHLGLLSPGVQSKSIYKSCGDAYRDQAILPLNGGL